MGKYKGGKFNGTHTTVVDGADDLVKGINKILEIHKISLGIIQKAGGYAPLRMKVTDLPAGAKLSIRVGTFTQEVYIYFSQKDRASVNQQLQKLAPERHNQKQGKPSKKIISPPRQYDYSGGLTSWIDEIDGELCDMADE